MDYDGVRLCGVPDYLGQGECKWPDGDITWCITDVLPGFTLEQVEDCAAKALAFWAAGCGIRPRKVDSAAKARILIGKRPIDGPGGVLAESELPCGSRPVRCRQWYDTGEKWVIWLSAGIVPGNVIDLLRVMIHELGHALGLGHNNPGTGGIMDPTYSRQITVPQAVDIRRMVALYGPPATNPTPAPTPVPIPVPSPVPVPGGSMDKKTLIKLILKGVRASLSAAEPFVKRTATEADDLALQVIETILDGIIANLDSLTVQQLAQVIDQAKAQLA